MFFPDVSVRGEIDDMYNGEGGFSRRCQGRKDWGGNGTGAEQGHCGNGGMAKLKIDGDWSFLE